MAQGQNTDPLHPFPGAETGMQRWVIEVPPAADEATLKIELQIGREQKADCNHQSISGRLERLTVQGWGYDYLVLKGTGHTVSTLIGCPPGSETVRFIQVHTDMGLQPYNSRLPLVVYVPDGFEVRYRIWRTEGAPHSASRL